VHALDLSRVLVPSFALDGKAWIDLNTLCVFWLGHGAWGAVRRRPFVGGEVWRDWEGLRGRGKGEEMPTLPLFLKIVYLFYFIPIKGDLTSIHLSPLARGFTCGAEGCGLGAGGW
jgi:hypothetical protein